MYKVVVFYNDRTTTMFFDDIRTAYEIAVGLNGIVLGGQNK